MPCLRGWNCWRMLRGVLVAGLLAGGGYFVHWLWAAHSDSEIRSRVGLKATQREISLSFPSSLQTSDYLQSQVKQRLIQLKDVDKLNSIDKLMIHHAYIPRSLLPLLPTPQSVAVLVDRESRLHTVSGQGTVKMTDAGGQTVRLDTAIALATPDKMRLRAWKFNQAVFDLTLTDQALYLVAPADEHREQIRSAGDNAGRWMRWWLAAMSSFFQQTPTLVGEDNDWLHFNTSSADVTVSAWVARDTLTVRRLSLTGKDGVERFTMTLGQYRQFDTLVFPTKLQATSPKGVITIELSDVELNTGLPSAAFIPPRRAEKLP